MYRLYLIFCLIGIVAGAGSGYLIGKMQKSDMLKITTEIQSELHALSDKISASRSVEDHVVNIDDEGFETNCIEQKFSEKEIGEIVRLAIDTSLKEQLNINYNLALAQSQLEQKNNLKIKEVRTSVLEDTVSKENSYYAQKLLSKAIESGIWDFEHAKTYQETLLEMAPHDQYEAIRQLFVAINNESLMVEEDAFPF